MDKQGLRMVLQQLKHTNILDYAELKENLNLSIDDSLNQDATNQILEWHKRLKSNPSEFKNVKYEIGKKIKEIDLFLRQ